jgi:hypothetical protein
VRETDGKSDKRQENHKCGRKEKIMDRSTRNKVWGLICGVVLCAGSVGSGQDIYLFGGETIAGDPNEPAPVDVNVPWDPAQHLTPSWNYVSLTSRVYNPVKNPQRDPNMLDRSVSISGDVEVVDPNGLIGLTIFPAAVLTLDQDGQEFYRSPDTGRIPFRSMYDAPRTLRKPTGAGQWVAELQPYHFSGARLWTRTLCIPSSSAGWSGPCMRWWRTNSKAPIWPSRPRRTGSSWSPA